MRASSGLLAAAALCGGALIFVGTRADVVEVNASSPVAAAVDVGWDVIIDPSAVQAWWPWLEGDIKVTPSGADPTRATVAWSGRGQAGAASVQAVDELKSVRYRVTWQEPSRRPLVATAALVDDGRGLRAQWTLQLERRGIGAKLRSVFSNDADDLALEAKRGADALAKAIVKHAKDRRAEEDAARDAAAAKRAAAAARRAGQDAAPMEDFPSSAAASAPTPAAPAVPVKPRPRDRGKDPETRPPSKG